MVPEKGETRNGESRVVVAGKPQLEAQCCDFLAALLCCADQNRADALSRQVYWSNLGKRAAGCPPFVWNSLKISLPPWF